MALPSSHTHKICPTITRLKLLVTSPGQRGEMESHLQAIPTNPSKCPVYTDVETNEDFDLPPYQDQEKQQDLLDDFDNDSLSSDSDK